MKRKNETKKFSKNGGKNEQSSTWVKACDRILHFWRREDNFVRYVKHILFDGEHKIWQPQLLKRTTFWWSFCNFSNRKNMRRRKNVLQMTGKVNALEGKSKKMKLSKQEKQLTILSKKKTKRENVGYLILFSYSFVRFHHNKYLRYFFNSQLCATLCTFTIFFK